MTDDPVRSFRAVLALAEFGRLTSGRLGGVRHAHESDEQTLERVLELARKVTCPRCNGRGRSMGRPCRECHGTGERAYDPHMPTVAEVMGS
jgi:RecJ-like exonuclease